MFEDEIKTALDDGDTNELSKSDILKNIDTSMYSSDELKEQEQIVEAILFMMGDSVTVDTLAIALSKDHDIALAAVERLIQKYETDYKDRGMKVIRINHKYQMVANNKYFQNLVLVASKPQKPVLTDAVLETLSIVAYKQPITKPEIEDIRGVKSDFAVNRLIEYGLIEEKGRLDAPGRPIILGTTEEFLLRFGLESTDDLPILPPTREAEIKTEVEKELTESLGEPVHVDEIDIKETEDDELELNVEEDDEEVVDEKAFNEVDENLVERYKDDNDNTDTNDNTENTENIDSKDNVDNKDNNDNIDNNTNDIPYVDDNYDIDNNNSTVSHERKDEQHDEKTGESEDKEPQ